MRTDPEEDSTPVSEEAAADNLLALLDMEDHCLRPDRCNNLVLSPAFAVCELDGGVAAR